MKPYRNSIPVRRICRRAVWAFTTAALFALNAGADPGFLSISFSSQDPVPVGDNVRVICRIFGYSDHAEIDRFRFNVTWPTQAFSFVPGSFDLGTAAGPDQQWLSKATQESIFDGFVLANQSDASTPGLAHLDVRDIGAGPVERGTLASDGFLISFELRAEQVGPGYLIQTLPHNGVEGEETLYGTSGVVLGVPQSSAAAKMVVPNTRLSITRQETGLAISWSTSAVGYQLQRSLTLIGDPLWTNVDTAVSSSNSRYSVTMPPTGTNQFFRLLGP